MLSCSVDYTTWDVVVFSFIVIKLERSGIREIAMFEWAEYNGRSILGHLKVALLVALNGVQKLFHHL
jgi:hypothetical protein